MKKLFIALMAVLCVHKSSAGVMSFCKSVFSSEESYFSTNHKDPLFNTLISCHLSAKQWFDNKKQIKMSEQGLKEMVKLLESGRAGELNQLKVSVESLIQKTSEIMQSLEKMPAQEALVFRKTALGVLTLFSKHIPVLLKEDPGRMDWPRINLIAKQIADFDPNNPRFSLYKIKRTIEGRYSLKEFILCRI